MKNPILLEQGVGKRTQREHLARYEFAQKMVAGKRVLDIACGAGYGSKMLKDAGAIFVDGVDINPEFVAYAKERYQTDGVTFSVGDILQWKGAYDIITCFETIEHIPQYLDVLKHFYGMLTPNGVLVLSTPNREVVSPGNELHDHSENERHSQEFNPQEIRDTCEKAGFRVSLYGQPDPKRFRFSWLNRIAKHLPLDNKKYSPRVVSMEQIKRPKYIIVIGQR